MPLSQLPPRSDSALIRKMLDQIEQALTDGASRESVWESLQKEHGMKTGFAGFCKALQRARKSSKAKEESTSPAAAPGSAGQQGSGVDCAIQKEPTTDMDCAIHKDAPEERSALKGRIITQDTFAHVHGMDFTDLDEKYK